jgi:hypothetical protein
MRPGMPSLAVAKPPRWRVPWVAADDARLARRHGVRLDPHTVRGPKLRKTCSPSESSPDWAVSRSAEGTTREVWPRIVHDVMTWIEEHGYEHVGPGRDFFLETNEAEPGKQVFEIQAPFRRPAEPVPVVARSDFGPALRQHRPDVRCSSPAGSPADTGEPAAWSDGQLRTPVLVAKGGERLIAARQHSGGQRQHCRALGGPGVGLQEQVNRAELR